MFIFSGKASSPTNTKGRGDCVVLGSNLGFGIPSMSLSNAFPNSELKKNTSITELGYHACQFGMLALDFLPIVSITHS